MKLIATVHSHFGAMHIKKILSKYNINSQMAPVPRFLSSSCGTCVIFDYEKIFPTENIPDDIEKIVKILDNDKYEILYLAEN